MQLFNVTSRSYSAGYDSDMYSGNPELCGVNVAAYLLKRFNEPRSLVRWDCRVNIN